MLTKAGEMCLICLKSLLSSVDLCFNARRLEFDGVEETQSEPQNEPQSEPQNVKMECDESSDAITEIRPMGRHPFNRQARLAGTEVF